MYLLLKSISLAVFIHVFLIHLLCRAQKTNEDDSLKFQAILFHSNCTQTSRERFKSFTTNVSVICSPLIIMMFNYDVKCIKIAQQEKRERIQRVIRWEEIWNLNFATNLDHIVEMEKRRRERAMHVFVCWTMFHRDVSIYGLFSAHFETNNAYCIDFLFIASYNWLW